MNDKLTKKLIRVNAATLAAAALASFILPMMLDSFLDGRGKFIQAMMQMIPLLAVIPLSCQLIAMAGKSSQVTS